MKQLAFIIILIALLAHYACEPAMPEEDSPLEHTLESQIHQIREGDLEIMEIEGCEYFIYKEAEGTNHGFGYMAHKGNCKNPIHCYRTIDTLQNAVNRDSSTLLNSDTIK